MANKINLFNDIWCDILFEDRNKEYGAFVLRKDASKRHLFAILGTLSFFVLLMVFPSILKVVIAEKKAKMEEVTVLVNLDDQVKKEQPKDVYVAPPPPPLKTTIKFTPPVIKPDELVNDEEEIKTQEEVIKSTVTVSIADVEGSDDANAVDIADLNQQMVEDTTGAPLLYVEQMPEFPGGKEALLKYLAQNINYPEIAAENGIQGMVILNFIVNTSGHLVNIEVKRGVGGGCDEEAMRVVKSMPKWIPGKQNGNAVRVQFTLPVRFVLN